MFDIDHDDVLDAEGKFLFAGGAKARQTVERWRIAAVGCRPVDFMGRDLIVASQLRDAHQWPLRRLIASPAPWMRSRVPLGLRPNLEKLALQITVSHFLHARQLHELHSQEKDGPYAKITGQVLRCWPYGVLVDWGGPGVRTSMDICDRARLCIHCFGRRVMSLYERLEAGLAFPRADQRLLVARAKISDETFIESKHLSLRDQCKLVRRKIGDAMISDARTIGADGGLITFTVSPRLTRKWTGADIEADPNAGFEFKVGVLARIPVDRPELRLLVNSGCGPAMRRFEDFGDRLSVSYRIRTGPQALRFALVGSSFGYHGEPGLADFEGVFSWPSWNLADCAQWIAHYEATQDMRLFDFWGSWIGQFTETSRGRSTTFLNAPERRGQYARRQAFASKNAERQREALGRREQQLQQLQALVDLDPTLARCGRKRLRERLRELHVEVSEHDARWLRSRLLEEYSTMAIAGE